MFAGLTHVGLAWRATPLLIKRVLVINGHPQSGAARDSAALCAAYAEGAQSSGCKTHCVDVGADPTRGAENSHWLRSEAAEILERLWQADRVFITFPISLGGPPPALRRILEEFKRWQGREAAQFGEPIQVKNTDVVVTADYPALVYGMDLGMVIGGWSSVLSGLEVARTILIGSMESISRNDWNRWLAEVRHLGSSVPGCIPGKAAVRCSR